MTLGRTALPGLRSSGAGPVLLALLLALAGCGGDGGDVGSGGDGTASDAAGRTPAGSAPDCSELVALSRDSLRSTGSGLRYRTLEEGDGRRAAAGDSVRVHYTGCLTNGTRFDASWERDRPFGFRLGTGQVIPGWDEGVAGMRAGEERLLVIPPDLAYGSRGAGGVIPPNSTLVFAVRLLEVLPEGSPSVDSVPAGPSESRS